MVNIVLFSLWLSSCFMLVTLVILVWILITILVGVLWLVFSLTRWLKNKRSWGLRLLDFLNTTILRSFTAIRQAFVKV